VGCRVSSNRAARSELTALINGDIALGPGAHVHCHGKGRKERITPLTPQTAAVLGVWQEERAGNPDDPLFPTSRGRRLSRDAVAWLLDKHAAVEAFAPPSSRNAANHTLAYGSDCSNPRQRRQRPRESSRAGVSRRSVRALANFTHAAAGAVLVVGGWGYLRRRLYHGSTARRPRARVIHGAPVTHQVSGLPSW
jgi:hypothetical protein